MATKNVLKVNATPELLAKIARREELAEMLKEIKVEEMELRKEIVSELSVTSTGKGTENYLIGEAVEIKLVKKQRVSVTSDRDQIDKVLERLPEYIADRIFNWKASLVAAEYKHLLKGDEQQLKLIDSLLSISDEAPTISANFLEEVVPASIKGLTLATHDDNLKIGVNNK